MPKNTDPVDLMNEVKSNAKTGFFNPSRESEKTRKILFNMASTESNFSKFRDLIYSQLKKNPDSTLSASFRENLLDIEIVFFWRVMNAAMNSENEIEFHKINWLISNKNNQRLIELVGDGLVSKEDKVREVVEKAYDKYFKYAKMDSCSFEKIFGLFFLYAARANRLDLCKNLVSKVSIKHVDERFEKNLYSVGYTDKFFYFQDEKTNGTALHYAIDLSNLELVKLILENTEGFCYRLDINGNTPIELALDKVNFLQKKPAEQKSAIEILKYLLEKSIDRVEIYPTKNISYKNVENLLLGSHKLVASDPDDAEWLYEPMKKHLKSSYKNYDISIQESELKCGDDFGILKKIVEILIAKNAPDFFDNAIDQERKKNIVGALTYWLSSQYLLNTPNFKVDVFARIDFVGNTLLHLAVEKRDKDIMNKLLSQGANPFVENIKGVFPLGMMLSLLSNDESKKEFAKSTIILFLSKRDQLRMTVDISPRFVQQLQKSLYALVKLNDVDLVKCFFNYMESVGLSSGRNGNTYNNIIGYLYHGYTLLQVAILTLNAEMVQFLIDRGARCCFDEGDFRSPLKSIEDQRAKYKTQREGGSYLSELSRKNNEILKIQSIVDVAILRESTRVKIESTKNTGGFFDFFSKENKLDQFDNDIIGDTESSIFQL